MKSASKIILLFTIFITSNSCFGISNYQNNDTLYVWEQSGIKLRDKPSFKSTLISILKFGDSLIALQGKNRNEYIHNSIVINDRQKIDERLERTIKLRGSWVKVDSNGKTGYVFDAYLAKIKPIKEKQWQSGLIKELVANYKVVHWVQKKDSESEFGVNEYILENAAYVKEYFNSGGYSFRLVLPNFSIEEAILIFRFYSPHSTDILQEDLNQIQIYQDLGGVVIKTFEDVIIMTGEWSC